ncbi:undecaprenyl-diphosphate phosphatase [Pseudomonadota bacterium]
MTLIQIIVLALIQGLTEFLPVSSSAHLILGGVAFGWPDQGLVFDVATHLGTLAAVFIYFRHDLLDMARACLRPVRSEADRVHRNMAVYLAIASLPALLVGFLARDLVEIYLRDVRVIAWMTIGFGLLLWLSDAVGSRHRKLEEITLKSAVLIGFAQALALIPGVSRSGVTITAGRFLGFSPDAAARFSFLLAIPIVAAAGGYGALKVALGDAPINWIQFGLAVTFAAAAGWLCIAAFLALLKRVGLMPFVIYRLLLGIVLIWLLY